MPEEKLEQNRELREKARTVLTNLKSFKDWSFAAYKVEEKEKDVVMIALEHYMKELEMEEIQLRLQN